jgi:hypothetical protein
MCFIPEFRFRQQSSLFMKTHMANTIMSVTICTYYRLRLHAGPVELLKGWPLGKGN